MKKQGGKTASGELAHLATFAKAAELSSFTAAAAALGLTQAAVSQRIRGLEQDLTVSLFDRHGGRVLLTEAGRRLYDHAQRILELHQEARRLVAGQQAPIAGELLLAASSIPGEHILPAILAVFHQRYPHIQVRATIADSLAVLHAVEQGLAALGLVGRQTDSPHLEYRPFATDRLVLVVPPRHRWRKRAEVSIADLQGEPLLLRAAGSGSRWCLEQALAARGQSLRDLHIALELGSNEAIKEALFRGAGVAVLSAFSVQKEIQAGRVHAMDLSDLPLERQMFVARDRRRVLTPAATVFLHFLSLHPAADFLP